MTDGNVIDFHEAKERVGPCGGLRFRDNLSNNLRHLVNCQTNGQLKPAKTDCLYAEGCGCDKEGREYWEQCDCRAGGDGPSCRELGYCWWDGGDTLREIREAIDRVMCDDKADDAHMAKVHAAYLRLASIDGTEKEVDRALDDFFQSCQL